MNAKMKLKPVLIAFSALFFLSFTNPAHYSTYTIAQHVQSFGNYVYSMFFNTPNLTCTTAGDLSLNGTELTITGYRLKNSGNGTTPVSYIGYYLSTDTEFTTDDYYIGQDYVDPLSAGFSSVENFSVNLANFSHIPDGTYYVGVIIDHLGNVQESNENDNNDCYWDSPTVVIGGKPNLSCNFGGELVVTNETEVRVTWIKVENTGVAAAAASKLCYYLSTDQNFTTDDFFVGSSDIPALLPSEFVMVDPFEADVATLGIPPGQYYLGFIIDCEDDVMESNEDDNNDCGFDAIIVIPGDVGEPNLACQSRGELTIDETNGTLNIAYSKVMSNGTVDAGASILGVYISTDQNVDANDVLVATQNIPAIPSGTFHMITPIDIDYLNLGLSAGTYYIGLVIDHTNLVAESNESDNANCSFGNPIIIPDPQVDKPNLVCDFRGELVVNNTAQTLYTSWNKILNTGAATAGSSVLGIYLSPDQNFTTSDLLIATANIPSLSPNQSYMITSNINVDFSTFNLAPGTYFVGLILDHTNLVDETSEADNVGCSWDEPRVYIPADTNDQPDLACDFRGELVVNNTAQTLYTSWNKIINNGTATAAPSVLGIYLSTDLFFNTNDILIATENVPALAPGAFYMVNENINVDLSNFNLAPGTYYVGLIIDHTNQVAESDENNNNDCFWNEPRVYIPAETNQPNLTCDFRGELVVNNDAQTLYTAWNAILNNGNATSQASVLGVYLSPDQNFTTSDLLLTEISIPALAAGQTYVVTNPANVDFGQFNLAPGTYFVGLIVDHTNLVAESDESDNATCSWNQPRVYIDQNLPDDHPNLLCKDRGELTLDGTEITIEFAKVQNNGTLVSQPANVGFYVSSDQNFTTSDYFIGSATVGQLFPSQFEMLDPFTADLVDFNIPAGNYFIGFVIDYDNQIEELDENDNNTCGWATIATIPNAKADLTCLSRGQLTINDAAQSLNIEWTKVQNIGAATSAASTVGYYISSDQNITTSDIRFATRSIGSLAPGAFQTVSGDVSFNYGNLGLAPGTYYVGLIVDYNNQVTESNENNNNNCHWDYPRINISAPINDPDLTCFDRGYLSITGTSVSITNLKIANVGSGNSIPTTVGVYLSTNQNFTTNDYFIGNVNLPALSVNQIHTLSFSTDVASLNLPAGDYYVGIIVDESNLVAESDEGNNSICSWSNPQVHISNDLPNLVCDFGGEVVVTPGPHVRVTWVKVKNTGTVASAATTVGYYLSTDQFFTPNDYFIGSVDIPALAPNQVVMAPPFDVDVTGVPAGTYYIGFIIDHQFLVAETNEDDNNDCSFDETVVIYSGLPDLVCVDAGDLILTDNTPGVVEDNSISVLIKNLVIGNTGQSTASTSEVGFYLSTDNIYGNAGDILIGDVQLGGIQAGQQRTISQFATSIPVSVLENLAQGEYTIGVKLDHEFDVQETNEANNDNCSYDEVIIIDPMPNGPDLVCKDNGSITTNGTSFTVRYARIQNIGDLPSAATSVTFYASVDNNFTASDYAVGTVNIPALQPGQVVMLPNFTANLANFGIPAGNYNIGFLINPSGSYVVEQDGTLGCFWNTAVHIPAAQPNLTCMNRGEIEANGNVLDITWVKVQNNGGGIAGGSELGFYLSTDLNFTTNDIFMGSVSLPALSAGQSVLAPDFQIDLSALGLSAGTYYIGFIIDYQNVINETNEQDNNDCYWIAPKVVVNSTKPNLKCKDDGHLNISGSQLTVSGFKVENNGNGNASSFSVGYYLSTDAYFTTSDIYIGNTLVGGLPTGATAVLPTFSVDLSSLNIPPGTYRIGTIIDNQNHVHESNESDNNDCYWTTTLTVSTAKPDLACMSQGEVSIDGHEIEIGWVKVINQGNTSAGASKVGFYLSTDQNITSSDVFIGNQSISGLAAGQSLTVPTKTFNVASLNLTPGRTYYIGFIIDDDYDVAESNEQNNNDCYYTNPRFIVPANQGKPDLTVSCGNLNVSGSTLHLSNIIVTNIGNASAGASHVGYYLSLDVNFTTDDIFLGDDYVTALAAGQSSLESISIDISGMNIPSGTYYVGAIVDYKKEVSESDEVENHCCFYTRVQITGSSNKADLRCKYKGVLEVNGTSLKVVSAQIRNHGSATAAASKVGFYLSTDSNFTTADYFVGSANIGALATGQTATISWTGTIPNSIPTGTYYLGFIIDYTNVVTESNESNNNDCGWSNPIHVSNGAGNSSDCACTNYYQDFCEDFDSYNIGTLGPQSDCWTTWSNLDGTRQDGWIDASGGNQYLTIKSSQENGGFQDVILRLGDRTSGKYRLSFKMYIFSGDKAYYNLLHEFTPGNSGYVHAYEVYFNGNGTGRVRHGGINQAFAYSMNAWNDVVQEIDINNDEVTLIIQGQYVARWRFSEAAGSPILGTNKLASMNFYPVDGSYEYYIDEMNFTRTNSLTGGESIEARNALVEPSENLANLEVAAFDFEHYPNPTSSELTVEFSMKSPSDVRVELVNTVGQVVRRQDYPDSTVFKETMDVSDLPAGVYYIKVQTAETQRMKQVVIVK